jgi:hypothetical protein
LSFPFKFSNQNFVFLILPMYTISPAHLILLDMIPS